MSRSDEACKMREAVCALVDDALSPDAAQRVQEHLDTCESCRHQYISLRELNGIARTLGRTKLNERDYQRIERCKARALEELKNQPDSAARDVL